MTPDELYDLLRKQEQLTPDDLRILREGISGATAAFHTPENVAWLNSRLAVESITAMVELNKSIRKLDDSSTELISKTNVLTRYILGAAFAAVILAAAQVAVAVLQFHH